MRIEHIAEARYEGQGYELRIDVGTGTIDTAWIDAMKAAFHDIHEREYSRRFEDADVQIANVRVRAVGLMPGLDAPQVKKGRAAPPAGALKLTATLGSASGGKLKKVATSFYERTELRRRQPHRGPRDHHAVRLDDGHPARFLVQGRSRRQPRHHLLQGRSAGRGTRTLRGRVSMADLPEVGVSPGPPKRKRVEVDPITLRVLGGAFDAIAQEMAGVLFRMSYSSIIRESEDLGAGIFDPDGRELCESESTPMHIGSLPWYIRGFLQRIKRRTQGG